MLDRTAGGGSATLGGVLGAVVDVFCDSFASRALVRTVVPRRGHSELCYIWFTNSGAC